MKSSHVAIVLFITGGVLAFLIRKMFANNPTRMSAQGREWLMRDEGFRNKAYKDTAGYWTIGVGHLIDLDKEKHLLTATLSDAQVNQMFARDLARFERAVSELVTAPITQHEFDALVAFAYNVGEGKKGLAGSTLLKNVNERKGPAATRYGFNLWRGKGDSHALRRTVESMLFHDGKYQDRYELSKSKEKNSMIQKYLA